MKRLIFVPVIHTAADLGSLAEPVRARYERELGAAAWQRRQRLVQKLWESIRKRLDDLQLDYRTVRLYQDGLPLCGHEREITQELAGAGSLNHQLLLELVQKGATLMGTEDPQLLMREYQVQCGQLSGSGGGGEAASASPGEAAGLLEARDRFMAQRIGETLQDGEIGLLFLGALHRTTALELLGIQVESLL